MTAPKKPQDHKPKAAPKPKVSDVDGGKLVEFPSINARVGGEVVLEDGLPVPLRVTVTLAALDDFELLEEMHALEVKRNATLLPSVLRRFVGDDYGRVLDSLREDGRVKISVATAFLRDLIGALNPKS